MCDQLHMIGYTAIPLSCGSLIRVLYPVFRQFLMASWWFNKVCGANFHGSTNEAEIWHTNLTLNAFMRKSLWTLLLLSPRKMSHFIRQIRRTHAIAYCIRWSLWQVMKTQFLLLDLKTLSRPAKYRQNIAKLLQPRLKFSSQSWSSKQRFASIWLPFLVEWTSIYQLFCSPGVPGFDTLPYKKLGRPVRSNMLPRFISNI